MLSSNLYCMNFKCPHNLFWEELNLDREKIQMTEKALAIRNCCCLIVHPWTSEQIGEAWGITKEKIGRFEEDAYTKIRGKSGRRRVHRWLANA